jgi:hypothetical protein
MRWQEEVTLTSYEMQWTVRYFRYRSQTWMLPESTRTGNRRPGTGTGTGIFNDTGIETGTSITKLTSGTMAYRTRNQAIWEELMKKADCTFSRLNDAYQSPL